MTTLKAEVEFGNDNWREEESRSIPVIRTRVCVVWEAECGEDIHKYKAEKHSGFFIISEIRIVGISHEKESQKEESGSDMIK